MRWSENEEGSAGLQIITATKQKSTDDVKDLSPISTSSSHHQLRTIICPSCGHTSKLQDLQREKGVEDLPGLPAGVKFDPSDQEILQHLEAKVYSDAKKMHPLIDQFIPTIHGHNGICYTHPENLPGVSKEGQVRHFFHRPSKAYTTGTRKRRKVQTDDDDDSGNETRWHKTGKTRCVSAGGNIKGYKKILVLYTNYGRQRKPEKTNWVMHQYHLGHNEDEKDGELVLSKVFYQTQPRKCANKSTTTSTSTSLPRPPSSTQTSTFIFKSQTVMDYYNPMIPNLVVYADGSSPFIHHHLPSTATKGKPDNE